MESRAAPYPGAEMEIHRPICVAMGHPLNHQPPRCRKLIELFANTVKITGIESPQLPMDNYSRRRRGITRSNGAPHVHTIASCRESRSDEMRVVTHSADLWWVFAGNDVPLSHDSFRVCREARAPTRS